MSEEGFRDWLTAQGIDPATRAAITFLPGVLAAQSDQPEFTRPIAQYLDIAVSETRVANGKSAMADHADLLARIEARFGVPARIVTAIWGLETAYGTRRGDLPVLSALATLAFAGERREFFLGELRAALTLVENGDIAPERMLGSWAGAMGHGQFMPSSVLAHAVDFDGDGRRDIWGDDPTDALASIAHYLSAHGWQQGVRWGVETSLPEGFDFTRTGLRHWRDRADWQSQGLTDWSGGDEAALVLPAGAEGPALLLSQNARAILAYNRALFYVIGVGHLSDRIIGGVPFKTPFPADLVALSRAEMRALQTRLTEAGFDTQGADGLTGPNTETAIRAFQTAQGLTPDGFPGAKTLAALSGRDAQGDG